MCVDFSQDLTKSVLEDIDISKDYAPDLFSRVIFRNCNGGIPRYSNVIFAISSETVAVPSH